MAESAEPARKKDRRHWLAMATLGALGLVVGTAVQSWRARSGHSAEVERFWSSTVTLIDGQQTRVAQWKGQPLLVNFWATWCPPCVEEMPMIDRFFYENGPKGLQVLGIAIDNAKSVRTFLASSPVRYPVAVDAIAGAEQARELGNLSGGLPFSIFFSADGAIARRKMGKLTVADLEAWSNSRK